MIHCNKESLDKIHTKVEEIENKIATIDNTSKNLEINKYEHEVKQKNLNVMHRNLKKDNLKVDYLIEVQDNIIYKLIGNVDRSHQMVEKSKIDFENKIIVHNIETKKNQENVINELRNMEEMKKNMMKQEKNIIQLILGMSFIKK